MLGLPKELEGIFIFLSVTLRAYPWLLPFLISQGYEPSLGFSFSDN